MYLEIDEGFDQHPKTVRLCRVIGDVNAAQYLIRIWAWACRSAPDGDISGMEAGDIEAVARYAPADGKLYEAMTERWSAKFGPWIDVDGDSSRLHGWGERQGAAIKRMEKRAADMRALRDRRRAERDGHVASTLPERDTHVGDQTRPDQSSQDPDPLSSPLVASDPDQTRAKSNECAKSAHDWLCYFNARYWQVRGKQRGCVSDAKATANLQDQLDKQGEVERAADWEARERIVDEFLARGDPRTVEAGHKFAFFVSSFDGLRVPPDQRPKAINGKPAPMQARY